MIFEPLHFAVRLAAFVPKARLNLARFHALFAPDSSLREQVTPRRGARHSREDAGKRASTVYRHELGAASEACIQRRYRDLPERWWHGITDTSVKQTFK